MDGGLILLSGITIAFAFAEHLAVTLGPVRVSIDSFWHWDCRKYVQLLPVGCQQRLERQSW